MSTPNGVHAKGTSKKKAEAQKHLLQAVDHGWKPTHKESISAKADKLVAKLVEEELPPVETDGLDRSLGRLDHLAKGGEPEAEDDAIPEITKVVWEDPFVRAYCECAMWSSHDESDESGGDPIDAHYDLADWSDSAKRGAIKDCRAFQEKAADLLAEAAERGFDDSSAGHDFWLTRNGHGAGFWDRNVLAEGDLGDRLAAVADEFKEIDLYVGDDGELYLSGYERLGESEETGDDELEAWVEGSKAYDRDDDECPYQKDTHPTKHRAWHRGRTDAADGNGHVE